MGFLKTGGVKTPETRKSYWQFKLSAVPQWSSQRIASVYVIATQQGDHTSDQEQIAQGEEVIAPIIVLKVSVVIITLTWLIVVDVLGRSTRTPSFFRTRISRDLPFLR